MRIRKTESAVGTLGKIVNAASNSTKDTYSCDFINDAVEDIYSETETLTNKVWIDGKPIYRQVFTGDTPSDGNLSISITNGYIIDIRGSIKSSYGNWWIIPTYFATTGYTIAPRFNQNRDGIIIELGTYMRETPYIIIVEYTKTTSSVS